MASAGPQYFGSDERREVVESRRDRPAGGTSPRIARWFVRKSLRLRGSLVGLLPTLSAFPLQLVVIVLSVGGMTLIVNRVNVLTSVDNSASLYLVVVLAIAALYGAPQAVVASVLSAIAYNYINANPGGSFTLLDPDQWLTLLLLLLVGLVTSHLAGELRRRADEALQREHQALAHARLTEIVAQANDPQAILEEIFREFAADLALTGLALLTAGAERGFEPGAVIGSIDLPRVRREFCRGPACPGPPGMAWTSRDGAYPFTTLDGPGLLLINRDDAAVPTLRPEQVLFLEAAARQIGLAIDRLHLQSRTAEVEALRQTDRLKNSFLNAVSHDFRTPLALIKLSAQNLAQVDADWSSQEHDGFIRTIENNVDRLNSFIQNLLDLSQIESGVLHPMREPVSLPSIVDGVLGRLTPLFTEHPVTVEASADLPLVWVDPLMIDRALSNLLENAVYHTPSGTALTIRLRHLDQSIVVSVADTGPGLPPTVVPHLFDRCYRVETDRSARRGYGLGLAVARGMIEAHGGKIWVEAPSAMGTTISFSLPSSLALRPDEPAETAVGRVVGAHRGIEGTS